MASGNASDADGMIVDINVTPLVDIMLVLLIVFMLTANLLKTQAIEVNLPQAATGADISPTLLTFTLNSLGDIYMNNTKTDLVALQKILPDFLQQNKSVQAVIAADRAVLHGQVIQLIDVIRQSGITQFAINTDPER